MTLLQETRQVAEIVESWPVLDRNSRPALECSEAGGRRSTANAHQRPPSSRRTGARTTIADGFNGFADHLAHHDVMLWAVSQAPLAKLQAYKRRMGWRSPRASSGGSDFNYDFNVSFTEEQQRSGNIEHNYRKGNVTSREDNVDPNATAPEVGKRIAASTGTDWAAFTRQAPGMSAFALEDGAVYHTYSTYERGLDGLWGMYQWLDRAPRGRNEAGNTFWMRRHDEYAGG